MKTNQLLDLAKSTDALLKKKPAVGPQNDDELWDWIKENLQIEVPRVSVCPDHQSPFQFLADIYFERVTAAIAIANRGGSKTMISAIIHLLNSLFKPGCESAQLGAEEQQARRAYINLQQLLRTHGNVETHHDHPDLEKSIERVTEFKNHSKLEILIATPQGVNGPHPMKLATDEAELIPEDIFQESRNMSMSKEGIIAQDWITSTRKYAHGLMQKLLDENIEAERAGADPPYAVYTWCVFESAAQVPNCQVAHPDCENPCPCDRVVKGAWEDGSPRRFTDVCKGRLARSRGFMDFHDVHKTFRSTNQEVYEAQQLCDKPETSGLVFPLFSKERHGVKWWEPDPDNGPIYMSVDFGSTNPSAVNWYQVLLYDTPAYGQFQQKNESPNKILPAGTVVCFDELYIAEVGNVELAEKVVEREALWKKKYPGFRVTTRFADPQNRAGRLDWARHTPKLPTSFFITRDIKEQIKVCREFFRENRVMIDTTRCEMFCEEAGYYHYPKKQSHRQYDPEIPVDDFNHVMSNFRYCMTHLHVLETKNKKGLRNPALPAAGGKTHTTTRVTGSSGNRYMPREESIAALHPLAGRRLI